MPTLGDYYRDVATGIPIPESGYRTDEQDPLQMAVQNRDAPVRGGRG